MSDISLMVRPILYGLSSIMPGSFSGKIRVEMKLFLKMTKKIV